MTSQGVQGDLNSICDVLVLELNPFTQNHFWCLEYYII